MTTTTPSTQPAPWAPVDPACQELTQVADAVQAANVRLHEVRERAVLRARLLGSSWADIGKALGMTRQGACKRWSYLDAEAGGIAVVLRPDGTACFHSERLQEDFDPRVNGQARALSSLRSVSGQGRVRKLSAG